MTIVHLTSSWVQNRTDGCKLLRKSGLRFISCLGHLRRPKIPLGDLILCLSISTAGDLKICLTWKTKCITSPKWRPEISDVSPCWQSQGFQFISFFCISQGSYRSWKPGKSWNSEIKIPGPEKSWNLKYCLMSWKGHGISNKTFFF